MKYFNFESDGISDPLRSITGLGIEKENFMNIKWILAGLLAGLLASSAMAQPGPGRGGPGLARPESAKVFARADANGDGQVTAVEMAIIRGEFFDKLDRDGDGFLDGPEGKFAKYMHRSKRKQRRMARKVDRMQAADTDNDGGISWSEYASAPSVLFDRMDANGDGAISREEHEVMKKQRFSRMDVNEDGVLNQDDRSSRRAARKQARSERRAKLDVNQDGRISRDEFLSSNGRFMQHFDSNADGVVTSSELADGQKRGRGMQRGH
jgi:Ca2+-binding EF-hand superfamily protein